MRTFRRMFRTALERRPLPVVLGAAALALCLAGSVEGQDRPGSFRGQRWAVVIGISNYDDPQVEDLRYANRDAELFYEFLTSPRAGDGGIAADHIQLLTDETATAEAMRTALFEFLALPGPDDVVYFYFAGHGMPQAGVPNGTAYLLPKDARRNALAASAIRMRDVESALEDTRARVVMFIDACHSGAVGGPSGVRAGDANRVNMEFLERLAVVKPGTSILVAARDGEYAQEGEKWGGGHGVFTYNLVDGLSGRADANGDGIVIFNEAYEFVSERVRQDTNFNQNPVGNVGTASADLPLGISEDLVGTAVREPVVSGSNSGGSPLANLRVLQSDWFAPDSVFMVVGVPDTLEMRLDSPVGGELVSGSSLQWRSFNPAVVAVNPFGVLTPVGEGVTTVRMAMASKQRDVLVRVYPKPRRVQFTPEPGEITITQYDAIRVFGGMEFPDGGSVDGVLPLLTFQDTSAVAPRGGGRFAAVRPGQATVTGTLAGVDVTWTVRVLPPRLQISRSSYGAMRLGDTLSLSAGYVRQDGSVINEAQSVRWQSDDTTVVRPSLQGLIAMRQGRAVVRATEGTSRDSTEIYVMGDLLIAVDAGGRKTISSASMRTGDLIPILQDEPGGWSPALSPDGRTIAFVSVRGTKQPRVYLMNADGTNIRRLTTERRGIFGLKNPFYQEHTPTWSSDGSRVFFVSNSSGNYDIYSVLATGLDERRITRTAAEERWVSAAPDAPRILFERAKSSTDSDIWVALEDGTEAESGLGPRSTISVFSEARPVALSANQVVVAEIEGDYREGESLTLFDVASRERTNQLVRPRKDNEILFAVSPAQDLLAYVQQPRLGMDEPVVVVMNFARQTVGNVPLRLNGRVTSISWGAMAASSRGRGER